MGCAGSTKSIDVADAYTRQPVSDYVFHSKYQLGEMLGEGYFGKVRMANQRSFNTTRAAKIIDFGEEEWRLREAEAEADVMRLVGAHPHCVQLFETFTGQSQFYLVMERCAGSLADRFDKGKCTCDDYLGSLFRDMLLGIAHLHRLNLVHCDVKPSNFLLGEPYGKTVKLADFGMTCKMAKKGYLTNHRGTAPYMSPEVAGRKPYDFRADIWSMGVTAYELLYGGFPYVPPVFSSESMKKQILIGKPEPSFSSVIPHGAKQSLTARDFVRTLMKREQTQRCTAQEALRLSFLSAASMQKKSNCQLAGMFPEEPFQATRSSNSSVATTASNGSGDSFTSDNSSQDLTYSSEDSDFNRLGRWLGFHGSEVQDEFKRRSSKGVVA